MKSKSRLLPVCLALSLPVLLLSACKTGPPDIAIESAEAAISPMLVGVASVFMRITNAGGQDTLLGARTDLAGTITELHDIKDGKMIKADGISIPADSTVVLRPARQHIMIFKLPKSLKEGDQFSLFLNFKKSGQKAVQLRLSRFSPRSHIRK